MEKYLKPIKKEVRKFVAGIAQTLHETTQGAIRPNHITVVGVVLHLIILLAIINNQLWQAGLMLIVFGLFDTLDGELARLQGSESAKGAFLDAVADRAKEVIIYMGIAVWLSNYHGYSAAAFAVMALGGSMLVSYIKAKGESEVRAHNPDISKTQLDKLMRTGLMQFEVRMFLLVIALLAGWIFEVVLLLIVLSWWTAFDRLLVVNRYLDSKKAK